jgi:hypothetical protein
VALDAAISIGTENTYGAPAATTEGYEGKADSWKTTREFIESTGFRAGMQTVRADRRRIVDMGGEGEIECDVLDSGAGSLLRAIFDTLAVTPGAAGTPSTLTYRTATHTASPSFTAQMLRPKVDGGLVAYKHLGCVATEWEFSQELEEPLSLTASFDFQTVTHTTTAAEFLPIRYPAESVAYDWTRGAVFLTRGGVETQVAVTQWSAKGTRGLKTDRRAIRANELKRQPKQAALPEYEGELAVEFDTETLPLYESFIKGEIVGLRIVYTGVTKSGNGTVSRLEFRAPAIQFTGTSPEASLDELTTMTLPFRVLDPGNGDAYTAVYSEPSGADPTAPAAAPASLPAALEEEAIPQQRRAERRPASPR